MKILFPLGSGEFYLKFWKLWKGWGWLAIGGMLLAGTLFFIGINSLEFDTPYWVLIPAFFIILLSSFHLVCFQHSLLKRVFVPLLLCLIFITAIPLVAPVGYIYPNFLLIILYLVLFSLVSNFLINPLMIFVTDIVVGKIEFSLKKKLFFQALTEALNMVGRIALFVAIYALAAFSLVIGINRLVFSQFNSLASGIILYENEDMIQNPLAQQNLLQKYFKETPEDIRITQLSDSIITRPPILQGVAYSLVINKVEPTHSLSSKINGENIHFFFYKNTNWYVFKNILEKDGYICGEKNNNVKVCQYRGKYQVEWEMELPKEMKINELYPKLFIKTSSQYLVIVASANSVGDEEELIQILDLVKFK